MPGQIEGQNQLAEFGRRLKTLRSQSGWSRDDLANELHRLASAGPEADYRLVDAALIGKWERTQNKRRPTRPYLLHLIKLFRAHLSHSSALEWAVQAGYKLAGPELAPLFSEALLPEAPLPQPYQTLRRLQPPPAHRLFGLEEARTGLGHALADRTDHWIIAIQGTGGIGKTTLASVVVQDMLQANRFYDLAWISAKQVTFDPYRGVQVTGQATLDRDRIIDELLRQIDTGNLLATLPADQKSLILTHWLKTQPYLIVIDNLETVEDYERLMPALALLARPSKFLLTSRAHLEADSLKYNVGELAEQSVIDLLRYLGRQQHLTALSEATPPELAEIYEVVGGNPLALKLVVGQIRGGWHRLSQILNNLRQAKGATIDQLYTFIYRQAWEALDEPTRRLFVIMPLSPRATQEDLKRLSKLPETVVLQALHELATRSLVEVRGDLETPYYSLHRLTETFLLNEVIQWKQLP